MVFGSELLVGMRLPGNFTVTLTFYFLAAKCTQLLIQSLSPTALEL